ncbi:MAG: TonB-dependent receptor plug domain-containing protein [Longimicrobiales bacterium]
MIDGSPVSSGSFGSTLASISVHDIARIDVLKDAAAAAIYGIRGANGVVVVTTRRGR